MVKQRVVRHFRDVFLWRPEARFEVADVLAAGFGMAGPVLAGLVSGHEAAGFAAALGGLAVNRVESGTSVRDHVRHEIGAVAPAFLAAMVAIALAADENLAAVFLVATVMIAALIGGVSRPMAVASTRFIIFLMIVGAVPDLSLHDGPGLLGMMALGAIWTSALGLGFAALMRGRNPKPREEASMRQPSVAQRLRHGLRALRTLAGWTYTLRLGGCLSVAALLQWIWPDHHFHWIGLTVALLISRRPEPGAVRTTQRTLGTGIGVLLAGLLPRSPLPAGVLVVLIGGLAGARSHFRQGNYLAYSMLMTPLVVLIIDAGQPPDWSLLADRLMATVIAGLLVTLCDLVLKSFVPAGPSTDKPGR
ncbi:Fusaric acid resistance protein-like [Bordetella sputigena]|uniref:FUSC family protein n=1 Tax=Bordetella sputigena TaxID=1416810 RepID=UPI0039EDF803